MRHTFFFKIRNNNIILQESFRYPLKIVYCGFFSQHCTTAFRNVSKLHFFPFFFYPSSRVAFLCSYCFSQNKKTKQNKKPNQNKTETTQIKKPSHQVYCCCGISQFTNIVKHRGTVRQKSFK